jgi:hypothetical protein
MMSEPCHICGKPATAAWNQSAHLPGSVPSHFVPVCAKHNPLSHYRLVKEETPMSDPTPATPPEPEDDGSRYFEINPEGWFATSPITHIKQLEAELATLRARVAELEREKALTDELLHTNAVQVVDALELTALREQVAELEADVPSGVGLVSGLRFQGVPVVRDEILTPRYYLAVVGKPSSNGVITTPDGQYYPARYVAEQEAWRARAEGVLRGLAERKDGYHWPQHQCAWDEGHKWYVHAPDCPVTAARALLGEGGQ